MRKLLLLFVISAVMGNFVVNLKQTNGAQHDQVKLKASFHYPPTHSAVVFAQKTFSKLEQLTEGRAKVEVYHSSTLCKPPELWDALNRGIVDFSIMPLILFRSGPPWWGFELLPTGQRSLYGMHQAAANGLLEIYQEGFHSMGLKITVPTIHCPGFSHFLTKGKRVAVPEDMKGLKIQAAGPLEADIIKAVGATPVIMSHADVYEALMTGLIDGTMGNISSIPQHNVQEPGEYICMQTLGGPYVGTLVSEVGLNRLSKVDRGIFIELVKNYAMRDELFFALSNEEIFKKKVVPDMKEVVYPTPEQSKLWEESFKPVIEKWQSKAGEKGREALSILLKYNN